MKMLYGTVIGFAALLMVAPLAVAGPPSWDDQINRPARFKVLTEFERSGPMDEKQRQILFGAAQYVRR